MKNLLIALALCAMFVAGCETETVTPEKVETLLAEVARDSVSTSGSGEASTTQTISSTPLDFTDADSMRVRITFWGSTNNDTVNAIRIGYLVSVLPNPVFTISNTTVTTSETTIDTTFVSPKVNQSFYYQLNLKTATAGYLNFKDLKIYKK
jgi:hypothetical protein